MLDKYVIIFIAFGDSLSSGAKFFTNKNTAIASNNTNRVR